MCMPLSHVEARGLLVPVRAVLLPRDPGTEIRLVGLCLKHSSTEPSHLPKLILVANLTRFKITMETGTPVRALKLRLIVEGSPT